MQSQTSENSRNAHVSNHTTELCEKLNSFYETKVFSDICVIASDGVRFDVHKNILSAFSDYFMAMFGGALKEAHDNEVKIQEVNGDILNLILAFMYTGRIEFQSEKIEDILRASNFLQIKSLITEFCIFMEKDLDVNNCLDVGSFAEQHSFTELSEKAYKFASNHFDDVSQEQEFLKLNSDLLCSIISSEDLRVSSVDKVVLGLIEWIEYDKPNRAKYAYELFSRVRYQFLSVDFIKKQRGKICVQDECYELIINWLEWHASPDSGELHLPNESRLVLISHTRKHIYTPKSNAWKIQNDQDQYPETFSDMLKVNNKLIFYNQREPLKCLDRRTRQLSDLPEVDSKRCDFGLVVLKKYMYAVGGRWREDEQSWKRCVDKFNFSSRKWETVNPMTIAISHPQVAVVSGRLYVIGNGGDLQCFNPDLNNWTLKPNLIIYPNRNISDFSCVEVNGKLYVVGGKYQNELCMTVVSRFVYSFDPLSNRWATEERMKVALYKCKCISLNNRLIICGGFDDTHTLLNYVQEYNPIDKEWTNLSSPDNSYFGVPYAIISKNVNECL